MNSIITDLDDYEVFKIVHRFVFKTLGTQLAVGTPQIGIMVLLGSTSGFIMGIEINVTKPKHVFFITVDRACSLNCTQINERMVAIFLWVDRILYHGTKGKP